MCYLKIRKDSLQMFEEMNGNKYVHSLSQKHFLVPVSFFFFFDGEHVTNSWFSHLWMIPTDMWLDDMKSLFH